MSVKIAVERINSTTVIVGQNKTVFIEPNIIYVVAKGEQTDELSKEQSRICNQFIEGVEGKINYLIDLNLAGKSSPQARKHWQRLSEDKRTNKVALFGLHPVARVLASFVMGVSLKKDMLFFKTKEEAQDWLNS